MSLPKYLTVLCCVLTAFSVSTHAAIINQVDFPEAFIAKEKALNSEQESITAAEAQK